MALGGIIGWLASILARTDGKPGHLSSILLGMAGGLLGGFFLGPVLGGGNLLESRFEPMTLLDASIGAIVLLFLLSLFRRRRAR